LADLFDHLFKRNWTDPNQILGRANRLGVNITVPARILAIEVEDICGKPQGGIALVLRRLNTLLKNAKSGSLAFELGGKIFVYLPCQNQTQPQHQPQAQNQSFDKFKASLGRQILEATQWQFGGEPIVAFGTLCEKLEDFQTCFEQCSRLLMLARLFDRHGLVRQEDFGPFALLLSALDGGAAQEFMQQTIGQIEKYDREHATDLLKTAATFIDQGCRYQATAEELEVHASTLRYRLQRLLELFNLDLDDAETRFALSLALKLRAIFGSRPNAARDHPRI
jgi:purine catabolism regulator